MRILYLSLSPVPSQAANSVQVVKMCAAFVRAGHSVHLFCRRSASGAPDREALRRTYGVSEDLALTSIAQPRGRLIGRALYARRVACAAQPLLPQFDLVYGRDIYTLLAARRWGLPIIYEAHMPPANGLKRLMHRRLFAHPAFTRLVVVSQRLAEYYAREFPELGTAGIVVAPNGADPPADDEARRASRAPFMPAARSVGYVGQPAPHKGIDLVLALARAMPNTEFHLVGGSPEALRRLRAEGAPNLRLHGHIGQGELSRIYRSFAVVLAPYQSTPGGEPALTDDTQWGSPLKIFEYMAHGCCVVASDLPVIRELVGQGEAAVLCPPDNLERWHTAVSELLDDPERRRALSAEAERRFTERYTRDRRAETVLAGVEVPPSPETAAARSTGPG